MTPNSIILKIRNRSNHLGSSSLITHANGQLDQHYQYLPFSRRDCADVRSTTQLARPNPDEPSSELRQSGEPFVSQKLNTGVRFTFSGKERDSEPSAASSRTPLEINMNSEQTNLSYFGARYYTSDFGVWLSVDPKASEFPWQTPYAAMDNNPINMIDPTGMSAEPVYDLEGNHLGNTKEGFTGEVLIYSGDENVDFSTMTAEEAKNIEGVKTYDNSNLKDEAKGRIHTHVVNFRLNDGLNAKDQVEISYDPSLKSFYRHIETSNGKSNILLGVANEKDKSYEPGYKPFETTVENIRNLVLLHEYRSHGKDGVSGGYDHYQAYYMQVMHPQFLTTTPRYQAYTLMMTKIFHDKSNKPVLNVHKFKEMFYNLGGYQEYMKWYNH